MRNRIAAAPFLVYFLILTLSCSKSDDNNNTNPATITISGSAFSPASLSVKVGTVVTWQNNDAGAHTATADDNTTFDTGTISAGTSKSYTTTTAGTFPYHCGIHVGMHGTLIVTN